MTAIVKSHVPAAEGLPVLNKVTVPGSAEAMAVLRAGEDDYISLSGTPMGRIDECGCGQSHCPRSSEDRGFIKFTTDGWQAFVAAVKAGELDSLLEVNR